MVGYKILRGILIDIFFGLKVLGLLLSCSFDGGICFRGCCI